MTNKNWKPPSNPQDAIDDPAIYDMWLKNDPEGLAKAFGLDDGNIDAGAGNNGDQNQEAGADNSNSVPLTSEHIKDIADAVNESFGVSKIVEAVGLMQNQLQNLEKSIGNQITGAVKKFTASARTDGGQNQNISIEDVVNLTIDIGGTEMTVKQLLAEYSANRSQLAKFNMQAEQIAYQDKVRDVGDALRAKNFAMGSGPFVEGLAAKVDRDVTGSLIAKQVRVKSSLGMNVTKDMPLDRYLDEIARDNPAMILDTAKPGRGTGGGGTPHYTKEAALKDPALFEEWMEKDPEGCQEVMNTY